MTTSLNQVLDVRVAFEKAAIFHDLSSTWETEIQAHILGAAAQRTGQPNVPELFKNVPALQAAWVDGWYAAIAGNAWEECTGPCDVDEIPYFDPDYDEMVMERAEPEIADFLHSAIVDSTRVLDVVKTTAGVIMWQLADNAGRIIDQSGSFDTYAEALHDAWSTYPTPKKRRSNEV